MQHAPICFMRRRPAWSKLIRSTRRERGLRQCDVGAVVGVTQETVCHWETGHYVPSASRTKALCDALGIDRYKLESLLVEVRNERGY